MKRIRTIGLLSCFSLMPAMAQHTLNQGLYAPEPPADHAYVRVFNGSPTTPLDIVFRPGTKTVTVSPNTASPYFSIPSTQTSLSTAFGARSKNSLLLQLKSSQFYTGIIQENHDGKLIEDKKNSNKLKSMLTLYNLDNTEAAIDLRTADGKVKIFSNIKNKDSASLAVNPVTIDLGVFIPNQNTPVAQTSASMEPDKSYSAFAFREPSGTLRLIFKPNITEQLRPQ